MCEEWIRFENVGVFYGKGLFLPEFYESRIFSIDFSSKKILSIKFNENPSSGSRVVPMRTDIQTDVTKLVIAFRDLEPAPGKTEF